MRNLADINFSSKEREKRFLTYYSLTSSGVERLNQDNLIFALYSFFEEHSLTKAKQYLYNCGLLSAFDIIEFNDSQFVYNLHSIGYAMLSDNIPFLKERFAHLTFTDFYLDDNTRERIDRTMEDHVLAGDDGCVFVHTVQQFILGNEELIQRNIEIMERVWFDGKNQNNTMQYDVNFFKALLKKDKEKCEVILQKMVSLKIHQKRNDDPLLKKYISMPALGYAKLAWILGMEVEIKSKLIPKALLPVQPLEKYEVPYDFLESIAFYD